VHHISDAVFGRTLEPIDSYPGDYQSQFYF
jgi:hypothetical protein